MSEDEREPEDELREMLQQFLSGEGEIDPGKFAGAAGLPNDPAAVRAMFAQLQHALQHAGEGVDWSLSTKQAHAVIQRDPGSTTADERDEIRQAAQLAALWIAESTELGADHDELQLLSRQQWADATMPVWIELSSPVAESISDALLQAMREHLPEGAEQALAGADKLLRGVGGTLFAMQLGQVVGQLSTEVISGGDIGIPLLDDRGALLPSNLRQLGEGLEIPNDQLRIWMSVRELAHARLFRHAKWLRLHVLSAIREYASGISIDMERMEELASELDPQNPEQLRDALSKGALIPPKTDEQLATLSKLESTLALIEGWVDNVTQQSTARLPKRDAIAETVRRRRATGGPAESAFGTLVGLELRPRRLREASAFWQQVTEAVGPTLRDTLWDHPDLVPTGDDIDDPSKIIARLTGGTPEPDAFDLALEDLLDDTAARPIEATDGSATEPVEADDAPSSDQQADDDQQEPPAAPASDDPAGDAPR